MSLFPAQPAGTQPTPSPMVKFRDLEDAYIVAWVNHINNFTASYVTFRDLEDAYVVAWISHLNNFTASYVNALIQYFNPSSKISNAALLTYIHRCNEITSRYRPQPVQTGWRASVPPKRTPAYFAYWVAREPPKSREEAKEAKTVEALEDHPPTSTLGKVPDYATNDPKPRYWCAHCCWSASFVGGSLKLARHVSWCHHLGKLPQFQAVVYGRSRHVKTAAAVAWDKTAVAAMEKERIADDERVWEAMSMS